MIWKLTDANGETKTLEEWGITGVVRNLVSMGVDSVTFNFNSLAMDADLPFAIDSTVRIKSNTGLEGAEDVQWFYGRVDRVRRFAGEGGEGLAYTIVGPWWWLERTPFLFSWRYIKTGAEFPLEEDDYDSLPIGELLLFVDANGNKIGAKAQLESVLDYAMSKGVPLTYDSTQFPDPNPPIDEIDNVMCGEVIKRALRWSPDAVSWFDYTQDTPKLYIKRYSDLADVDLNFMDGERVEVGELEPRYDLQLEGVILIYKKLHRINDSPYTTFVQRKAPDDSVEPGLKVLTATINLEGQTQSYVDVPLHTEGVLIDDLEWWKARIPSLNNDNIQDLTLIEGSANRHHDVANPDGQHYAYEIVKGEWAEWMGGECEDDNATAEFSFTLLQHTQGQGNIEIKKVTKQKFTHKMAVTNLNFQGVKRFTSESAPEEPEPTNLHTYLYEAASVLHYDGEILLTDEDCPGTIGIGHRLNITGSDKRPEWATMRAMVHSVTESLDNRSTQIRVGPPDHLGYDDIIELLRVARRRTRFKASNAHTTGRSSSGGTKLGEKNPKGNSTTIDGAVSRMMVGERIAIDWAHVPDVLKSALDIRIRPLKYCYNGTEGVVYVLASQVLLDSGIEAQEMLS